MAAQDGLALRDVQRLVDEWCQQEWNGTYWPPLGNLARLVEEMGELARLINHDFGYKPKKAGEAPQELALEMGDLLFTLAALANSLEVDLASGFAATLQKYRDRDTGRYSARS
jgi:NTP pyrophosphatase (non-canonical NTP hydrolase)